MHLLFLSRELTSDEGGFAMVARASRAGGPYLYGRQWVDRPPGLMVVFELAQRLGPFGVRLTAGLCATALVAASAWAVGAVAGEEAAGWAAWTTFALATSPLLMAYQLNGEIIATPLVMLAVATMCAALYRSPPLSYVLLLCVLSGVSAASALLIKQNFDDGLIFVGVFLVGALVLRRFPWRRVASALLAFLAGLGGPLLWATTWAGGHGGVSALGFAMFGFRAQAAEVIADGSWHAPELRLVDLVWLALGSGLALLAVQVLFSQRRALLARSPLVWAVTVTAGVELLGVALGASYWPHYLIGLVPMVVFATGIACRPATGSRTATRSTRWLVGAVAAVTVLTAPATAAAMHAHRSRPYLVARWLSSSSKQGDTVVVAFTHANVIQASGLASPYPYSWSLPVRTLDPGLTLLTHTLDDGRIAPTWVVRWNRPHSWGLDPHNHVAHALDAHYRKVAVVCGRGIWLHRGADRRIGPLPTACGHNLALAPTR
ncbi:MAG: hypothetical protein ACJ72A_10565 [Nocardioidaceae bacterium]